MMSWEFVEGKAQACLFEGFINEESNLLVGMHEKTRTTRKVSRYFSKYTLDNYLIENLLFYITQGSLHKCFPGSNFTTKEMEISLHAYMLHGK